VWVRVPPPLLSESYVTLAVSDHPVNWGNGVGS
jgi:hypothetical protein